MTRLSLGLAAGILLISTSLAGCGKVGTLDQPAPLYGAKAKARYEAAKAATAAAEAKRRDQGIPEIPAEPDIGASQLPAGAAPPPPTTATPKPPPPGPSGTPQGR